MYKNILIPVSFEEGRNVDGAVSVARRLASDGVKFTFMHVIAHLPSYATEFVAPEILAAGRDDAKARLETLCKNLDNAHGVVVEGSPGRMITDWAKENDVDCIVVASHRPVMSDILLGSTAAFVVRHANAAVHVLR